MTQSQLHRPCWRKKRWIAAGLLWLGLTYPLSSGPVCYVEGFLQAHRQFEPVMDVIYRPVILVLGERNRWRGAWMHYNGACYDASQHTLKFLYEFRKNRLALD
jgi:hypothetical protein